MLRITRLDAVTQATVLRLEGRMTRRELFELESILGACGRERRRVVLDLAGIAFVDDAVAEWIRAACGDGAEVVGASSFVLQILGENPS